ncbi:error-prone DNA polymerase [Calidifontibacter sp. DB0510]|uniref:Error-prone DNA polymerase n=1 Tax=Metallococcus carri TaxID=1656884 RepID=A0A967EB89_9MICO|nr:error-prone DNA polymerase [Metallococcus carri]NHN56689.1 error-prone DNA polymerase [Metallococcus carri]NOP38988.1 error-prone DNA polymerase [Calidifontibacter sp. DB2511S]
MGFNNPEIPWSQLEQALSRGTRPSTGPRPPLPADGGDGPAFSRKRAPFRPSDIETTTEPVVPYAELHAHSHYSFLDGASAPEELVTEAVRLGLHGLALTDHDGLYGVVRLAEAAESYGNLTTLYGAELSFGLTAPQNGVPDPEGHHLVVLARGTEGYRRLATALTDGHLHAAAEKGRPVHDLETVARHSGGHWFVLTGCRKGLVPQAIRQGDQASAYRQLEQLKDLFGADRVLAELIDHGDPSDARQHDALAEVAARAGVPVVATNAVHYAVPERYPLATALAAVRARRSLDDVDGWLPGTDHAHLRSGSEMARRFARFPGAIERTVEVADECGFRLRAASPRLPKQRVPFGHTPMSWLRHLVNKAAPQRYSPLTEAVRARLAKELDVIEAKDFAGYFLIVRDIVDFAHREGILCQGRGSAAASAVCYVLGITVIDPIFYQLPFERFLSELRDEAPDIDVDFDSDRREEVIQYVYATYGRRNAAQVANVVTYRPKNAVRDMAKALGHSQGQQDAWSRQVERWGASVSSADHDIPEPVIDLARQVLTFPRHLGIHSGGMVLTDRPVSEVCPIEPARMEARTVLQWDKDDCAWMGLVKFDLLGLGILAAIQHTFDLVGEHLGESWRMETIPKGEPGVYDMLCRADTIGVFQVESRAQIGTLPRLKPRCFYDLAVEIGLIRPGPIQGGAVHPYIRRRTGQDPITYPHPLVQDVLERTLGVPLFQEQLMQMAMKVGGCSPADADLLRRAMGSKRGVERIDALRTRLYEGMAANGLDQQTADEIYHRIEAFANFGFAESHALSFAVLVYASSWLKLHYPGAFLAGLLRAQPMGFYSPQTLVGDARRHGVQIRTPDLHASGVYAGLEPADPAAPASPTGLAECLRDHPEEEIGLFDPAAPDPTPAHRRDTGWVVRLGLADVTSLGVPAAERIVAARDQDGEFTDLADLARRATLDADQLEALSLSGALDCLTGSRRDALWRSAEAARTRDGQLPVRVPYQPPLLPLLTPGETLMHDLASTGISPGDHPVRYNRQALIARGVLPVSQLREVESGRRIEVAGVVTHRQRPATAGGITFLNLEDETGLLNVVVSEGVWHRYRRIARASPAMVIRGILERSPENVINLLADRLEHMTIHVRTRSRDFR